MQDLFPEKLSSENSGWLSSSFWKLTESLSQFGFANVKLCGNAIWHKNDL